MFPVQIGWWEAGLWVSSLPQEELVTSAVGSMDLCRGLDVSWAIPAIPTSETLWKREGFRKL